MTCISRSHLLVTSIYIASIHQKLMLPKLQRNMVVEDMLELPGLDPVSSL